MTEKPKTHWKEVYSSKEEAEVSWFQESPEPSLELLALVDAHHSNAIIDIGGGASRLANVLLAKGFNDITCQRRSKTPPLTGAKVHHLV